MKSLFGNAWQNLYATLLSIAVAALHAIEAGANAGGNIGDALQDPSNLVVVLVMYLLARGAGFLVGVVGDLLPKKDDTNA